MREDKKIFESAIPLISMYNEIMSKAGKEYDGTDYG
jgi:hypothetical protein